MGAARRVTIDLTEEAADEMDRIRQSTGLSISEVFRHSFTLLRLYLEAKEERKEMRIVDPRRPRDQVRIELPTIPRSRKAPADPPKSVATSK